MFVPWVDPQPSVAVRCDLTTLLASTHPHTHASPLIKEAVKAYRIACGELIPPQHGAGKTPPPPAPPEHISSTCPQAPTGRLSLLLFKTSLFNSGFTRGSSSWSFCLFYDLMRIQQPRFWGKGDSSPARCWQEDGGLAPRQVAGSSPLPRWENRMWTRLQQGSHPRRGWGWSVFILGAAATNNHQ